MPGEIADMMLNGTMCAGCGMWLHDGEDGDGFPEYCASCQPDEPLTTHKVARRVSNPPARVKSARDTECPFCKKKMRGFGGLKNHMHDTHKAGEFMNALKEASRHISDAWECASGRDYICQEQRVIKSLENAANILNPFLKNMGIPPITDAPF